MVGYVVVGLVMAVGAGAWLLHFARRARAAWRGEPTSLPQVQLLEVGPRTYPSALLTVAPLCAGAVAGGVTLVLRGLTQSQPSNSVWVIFAMMSGLLLMVALLLAPLNWLVHATNRPRMLVPPAYRDRPGSLAVARERRRRRRAGLPETDHLVEVIRVAFAPDDPSAFFVATCTDPDCSWSEATEESPDPAEEALLRASAARHSSNVAATRDQL